MSFNNGDKVIWNLGGAKNRAIYIGSSTVDSNKSVVYYGARYIDVNTANLYPMPKHVKKKVWFNYYEGNSLVRLHTTKQEALDAIKNEEGFIGTFFSILKVT